LKTVLITGASSGLGRTAAGLLAAKRFRVVLLARNGAALDEVCSAIKKSGGEAMAYPVDLSDATATEAVCDAILKKHGAPDIIINNAGSGIWREIEATTAAESQATMAVPYFSAMNVTRAFAAAMLRRNSGHIINVTSPAAFFPFPGAVAYGASRWAMRGFNEALYADLCRTGIKVSLFCPGKIESEYFANNPGSEERIPSIDKLIPALSTQEAAEHLYRCLQKQPRIYFAPYILNVFAGLYRIMPGVIDELAVQTGWRRSV
jgi:uncharacterized protein